MSKKIIFIADFFENEIPGGGEKCNEVLIEKLENDFVVEKKKSALVTKHFLEQNKNNFFIFANFALLSDICKETAERLDYVIYEHDHKYVEGRNPAIYKNFEVPEEKIVNLSFYQNAKKVICQSGFHRNIVEKNIKTNNVISSHTNFWSDRELNILKKYSLTKKEEVAFVLDSTINHKNTFGSSLFCEKNNLKYFKYGNNVYEQFIKNISHADKFVFLPKTPETFGRVATECKILGMKIYSNKFLGVSHEDWFRNKNGEEVINYIKDSNQVFLNKLKEVIND